MGHCMAMKRGVSGAKRTYLFQNGVFAEGLNPSGYTLDKNEIKISNRDSFTLDYNVPNKLIYIKWYSPSGQANSINCFPTLMNTKKAVTEKGGYLDFTLFADIEYVSCISSKDALQIYKGYGTNYIKIKEIWVEDEDKIRKIPPGGKIQDNYLFKDGIWNDKYTKTDNGTILYSNDIITMKVQASSYGTQTETYMHIENLKPGNYVLMKIRKTTSTTASAWIRTKENNEFELVKDEPVNASYDEYTVMGVQVDSNFIDLGITTYVQAVSSFEIKEIWMEDISDINTVPETNRAELYRNLSPTAYSHNNNALSSPPFTVEINPVYDYYEIEAVYSDSLKYYGKVIVSKDDLSPNNDANCAGIAVGYIQNGTQALSVSRTIRLNGTTLSFSNSYASNFCLITGIWGLKGTI